MSLAYRSPLLGSQPEEADPLGVLASSASRGLAPREGLELLMLKLGRTRPSMEPRRGLQVAKSGFPHSQNADSHDDQGQAGASGCSVPVSFLVLRRQAGTRSPEESGKGFHIGATRPRPPTEVIAEPTIASPLEPLQAKTTFVRITCTSCLPLNLAVVGSLPTYIWEEDQGHYK